MFFAWSSTRRAIIINRKSIWFDYKSVCMHNSLSAAALQCPSNCCPFSGQLKSWQSQRVSWAWCSHSGPQAERGQRSQVPLIHTPKTTQLQQHVALNLATHQRTWQPITRRQGLPLTASNGGTSRSKHALTIHDHFAAPDLIFMEFKGLGHGRNICSIS